MLTVMMMTSWLIEWELEMLFRNINYKNRIAGVIGIIIIFHLAQRSKKGKKGQKLEPPCSHPVHTPAFE